MIEILNYTSNPITYVGLVAGTCWGADTSDKAKNYKRGLECIENNHGRTFEYPDITFVISEYSARVIREVYTSIVGTSRLQESTRYVDCEDFSYYTPPSINNELKLNTYNNAMESIQESYGELIELGIPKEDVANILPLGMDTKIVLKINLRALIRLFEVRTCTRAYKEYRKLMNDIKQIVSKLDEEWSLLCKEHFLTICDKQGFCIEKFSCLRKPKKEDIEIVTKEELRRLQEIEIMFLDTINNK